MKWWGWGDPGHETAAPRRPRPPAALRAGRAAGARRPPVALDQVELPEPALGEAPRGSALPAPWAPSRCATTATRVTHAAGKGYPDLVRLRSGDAAPPRTPSCYPGTAEEVRAVLAACAETESPSCPFGGGTSVVGGVEPAARRLRRRDLARPGPDRQAARGRPAVADRRLRRGPARAAGRAALAAQGLTLGHFPQSFEYATVGGWVATRSAGQASTGYGSIDKLVAGLRCVCPAGARGAARCRRPPPAPTCGSCWSARRACSA